MDLPTVIDLRARPVNVPLTRPLTTSSGDIDMAPLVLLDLATNADVSGHAYVFCYTPLALEPMAELLTNLSTAVTGHALAPRHIAATLERAFRSLGVRGLTGMAAAAIDMAAWDALARFHDQPLARLLGGDCRAISAYDSLGFLAPEDVADAVTHAQEGGFRGLKLELGHPRAATDVAVVDAVRRAGGTELALMVDYNQSLSVAEALARCSLLMGEGLYWIEEPVRSDDLAGCARVAGAAPAPIQLGENWWGVAEMAKSIAAGANHYGMPDAAKIGGVSGWMDAAGLAQAHDLPLSSHLFPELSAHLLAVTPTAHWLEYRDIAGPILREPVTVVDGAVTPSDEPGAGIDWDEAAVKRYET